MRTQFCHAAVALALVAGAGAANAQTVITREIATEPVETIIERGPTGTVITRRPLDTGMPRTNVVTQPIETRETVGSVTTTETDELVTRRATAPPARAAAPRKQTTRAKAQVRRKAAPPPKIVARAPVEVAPALTPTQRSRIYRAILEAREVPRTTVVTRRTVTNPLPPLLPPLIGTPLSPATTEVVTEQTITRPGTGIVAEPVETEPVVTRQTFGGPVVTEQVVAAPRAEVTVGARLPGTVPLYALPTTIVRQVPSMRSYQYAVIDDRVFLVDPQTSVVMAELNE
jgi:hypothetical protein